MKFKKVDLDNTTEEEIKSILKDNSKTYSEVIENTNKLLKAKESSTIEIGEIPTIVEEDEVEESFDEVDTFKEELKYYVEDFKTLRGKNIEEHIDDLLPSTSNYNYKKIVQRLMLEVAGEIHGIYEMIEKEKKTSTKEELEFYKEEIVSLNNVIAILRDRLKEEVSVTKRVEKENKLVFVPTSGGNIRVFDELKSIPEEYYEGFLELFKSIKDGSFKNVRRFDNSKKLSGLAEVKDFKIRIAFQRLSFDTYAIVSMFMKKSQNDMGYRKSLEVKYNEYKNIAAKYKRSIDDEEFMELHKGYEEELFRILGGEKDNGKGGFTND